MVQYTTIINATLSKVWEHLLLKIEHPEHFVPGLSNVSILDKNTEFVTRQMTITTEEKSINIKEKITYIPYNVRFFIVEHPEIEGFVDNEINYISETKTEITFTMNWKNKITKSEINNLELVKKAVLKTKEFIEKTNETTT